MPELPEVETIKNALVPIVVGQSFLDAEIFWKKVLSKPALPEFRQQLIGQEIIRLSRRGKYFLFELSKHQTMVLHLKMTGVLLLKPASEGPGKYTTVIFRFDGGNDLHFNDQRKFGSLWLVEDANEVVGKLGPEPLNDGFTPRILRDITSRHGIPIKALLCDQHSIAGVGNMYADEALFAARIHPLKKASELSIGEINGLHQSIIEVLERGIRHNGASISSYCLPDGTTGLAHTQFRVAHRLGENCLVCGSLITRIKIRGRGTYFCPECQPESGTTKVLRVKKRDDRLT